MLVGYLGATKKDQVLTNRGQRGQRRSIGKISGGIQKDRPFRKSRTGSSDGKEWRLRKKSCLEGEA